MDIHVTVIVQRYHLANRHGITIRSDLFCALGDLVVQGHYLSLIVVTGLSGTGRADCLTHRMPYVMKCPRSGMARARRGHLQPLKRAEATLDSNAASSGRDARICNPV